ncbi:hypothetical protein A2U01_0095900, partial [Trifolium medium]|nr:hypothetical protein [Trifolium medium]
MSHSKLHFCKFLVFAPCT